MLNVGAQIISKKAIEHSLPLQTFEVTLWQIGSSSRSSRETQDARRKVKKPNLGIQHISGIFAQYSLRVQMFG